MPVRTSAEFVEILDEYLKEKKISRRQFSALVDIPNTTISSWKSKNLLPSIELVAKVAKFMNVSLDWLVNGEIAEDLDNSLENVCSRRSILYRIEIVLRQNNEDRILYECIDSVFRLICPSVQQSVSYLLLYFLQLTQPPFRPDHLRPQSRSCRI